MRDNVREARLRLGRNIKRHRELRRLSQERLAEIAGTSTKHVGEIELAKINPTIGVVISIAMSLSVNVGDLLGPTPGGAPGWRVLAFRDSELDEMEQMFALIRKAARAAKRRK